ncbi:MAG: type I DNA topoisomerase, partial [Firmicutes bacterium]|nr:type I DNA topoisomerase [Bacillota bacterium]
MANYLVIVESPSKAKTIKKYLGSSYTVVASQGHIRDLPKSQLGIDIQHDFEPHYITIRGKGDLLAELKKEAKKADKVYLATDPDREGEAISWHLAVALGLQEKDIHRVTFNEITKTTVKSEIKKPRKIDMDLVNAQQARRALDRIVGYEISPILWEKVKKGLSAGRVQSVALKLLCEREDEINDFVKEEFWTLESEFSKAGDKGVLATRLSKMDGAKAEVHSEAEADEIIQRAQDAAEMTVKEIRTGRRVRKSPDPFTTSTLQQEASRRLNFTPSKTMRIAQELYEGVEIPGRGPVGLISYLRTDSTRVSDEAQEMARAYITDKFGDDYLAKTEKKT